MRTIIVVNGENYWHGHFKNKNVIQIKIQNSEWIYKNKKLHVVFGSQVIVPDAILWRVGAIKPSIKHLHALHLIKLSKIPCVNDADVLLQGFDRLSMLSVLQACNLPVVPFNVITNSHLISHLTEPFPFVIKAGNYHGGFGKMLIETESIWQDVQDILFISEDYVVAEPYINYVRDLRYLAVGDDVWAMARKGRFWKANVHTTDYVLIDLDEHMVGYVKTLQDYLKADVVAMDIIEDSEGNHHIMGYNDIPSVVGFPNTVIEKIAACLLTKLG